MLDADKLRLGVSVFVQVKTKEDRNLENDDLGSKNPGSKNNYLAETLKIIQRRQEGQYAIQKQPFNTEFNDLKRFILVQDLFKEKDSKE